MSRKREIRPETKPERDKSIAGVMVQMKASSWLVWKYVNRDGSEFIRDSRGFKYKVEPEEYEVLEDD